MVEKLQAKAARDPGAYRRRVLGGALLGYLVVFGLLAVLLALIVGCVLLMRNGVNALLAKVIFVAGISCWLISRSLFVKVQPPVGRPITAEDAPDLFALIEEVRTSAGGPALAHVLVTEDFNAAIVQHPRLGAFGMHENYLLLGLPLLQALPVTSVKAVIAHEFGHLVNADGKLSTWVYRVRMTWAQLSENLQSGASAGLLKRFFEWYGPWFNALSFGLARNTEFAADAVSARVASNEAAGRALIQVAVEADRYGRFHWPEQFQLAGRPGSPVPTPFASAGSFFRAAPDAGDAAKALTHALGEETGLGDTHPSLSDRLRALGVAAEPVTDISPSAAQMLLPDAGSPLAQEFDRQWWAVHGPDWEAERDAKSNASQRLETLEARPWDALDLDERLELADATEWLKGPEEALPLYQAVCETTDSVRARYAAARILLDQGDRTALNTMLDLCRSGGLSSSDRLAIAQHALGWLAHEAPDDDVARLFLVQRDAAISAMEAADAEIGTIDSATELLPTELPGEALEALRDTARQAGIVSKLWVASTGLRSDMGSRRTILLFEAKHADAQAVEALMEQFSPLITPFGPALMLQLASDRKWLKKLMDGVAGALIYERSGRSAPA